MALPVDAIEDVVLVGEREIALLRPRDSDALLDERAFERDEFIPYWADLWPSGLLLAKTLAKRALHGRSVLELGCGLGLPAICAALAGGRVTGSDWSPDAIELLGVNATRNGAAVAAVVCSWRQPDALVDAAPWDLVLAADVLYERRNLPLLLALLPRLVDERGTVWLSDPGRAPLAEFLETATDDGWVVEQVARSSAPRATVYALRRA